MDKNSLDYLVKPWLNQYDSFVSPHIQYDNLTICDYFEKTVAQFPSHTAVMFEGYALSYQELKKLIDQFATELIDFGIQKGDRVAVVLPNTIQTIISYLGILKIGAIAVMSNPNYTDRELEYQFNDSEAKMIITIDLIANRIIEQRSQYVNVKTIIYTTLIDYLPLPQKLLFSVIGKHRKIITDVKKAPNVFQWKTIMAKNRIKNRSIPISMEDIAMYQYTSGTTGKSKGVMLTHGNISKQIQQIKHWFSYLKDGEECVLGAIPFFHILGIMASLNISIAKGWTNIIVPKPVGKLLLESILKYNISITPLIPTMMIGILNEPNASTTRLSSIKICLTGSASTPLEVIKAFEKLGNISIIEGYGLTESSPVTHMIPAKGIRKTNSIGIPLPDTECRIIDLETGLKDVPIGEPGELLIKGPQVMTGYLNRPKETLEYLKDGWLYTGDIATMDEDGFFYIVDRKKDIIPTGEYTVYPREVEEVLIEHPKVNEACSVGIHHLEKGNAVMAFVVLKEGMIATQDELINFCKDKLAGYKHPVKIEFKKELPKNAVGKVLRRVLKASV